MELPELPVHVAEPWLAVLLSSGARIGAFVWGAIWGSFANVVIHRVPRGESIVRPRSRCPGCGATLGAIENVPILSYLVLRGKCRHCGEPIALRYLVVELLAGLLGFATYMRMVYVPLLEGSAPNLGAWLLAFAFCLAVLVVVFVDLDVWIIPDVIVLPMAVVGLLAAALVPEWLGVELVPAALAAASGYLVFAGIRQLYLRWRGIDGLGLGDAKLLAMVGAFCGPVGVAWCVGAGAVQGLVVAVPMLLAGRRIANTDLHDVHGDDPELGPAPEASASADTTASDHDPHGSDDRSVMGRHVPFGPFLGLAALEYMLLGDVIDAALSWLVNP
ncbi:MAG TPA: prepilin peptidase [Nannocystaceae bacterium]|nr:prepilin peptidase [Nannocystaceae bacterium]